MHALDQDDADVPVLAVQGLNAATRTARQAGDIVLIHNGRLVTIASCGLVELIRVVPGRTKVTTRTERLKR